MGGFLDILILLSFLLEVAVLFYLELKAWKSMYTPLVFLMLPYTVVLLITIAISGNFGFVEFYYPSIFFWSVGLLIFAIPSLFFAYILQKHDKTLSSQIGESQMPRFLVYLSFIIIFLFALRLKSMLGGALMVGSDEFGEEFCGRGFWGHLRIFLLPLLAMAIYFVDSKNKWLWFIILPIFIIAFLYQVKGWVIIPCLTGIILRLYSGKTKLKASLILTVVIGALLFFLGSYILILVIAGDSEFNMAFVSAIFEHFIHYLTSGTLGLSVDMQHGLPDKDGFEMVIAQFINLGKAVVGDDDFIIPLNPLFYNTGVNLTNVRTLFGTVFINSGYLIFMVYVLFLSSMMYLMKCATVRFNNIYLYTAYFFQCGLLFMGWFDSYFASLAMIEVPIFSLLLLLMDKMIGSKNIKRELE